MTWNIFCVSLCLALIIQGAIAVAQAPMAMGPMSMGGNGGHNDTCILMPSMSECANFHMPDPRGDITTLCGMMSNMPGCSIDNICHSNTKLHETEYCTDFSIVKNLCTDMPKMSGCQDYTRMCANGTVVKECDTPSLKTPPTMFLMSAIKKICTDMPTMEQCSKCPDNMDCDLLVVYSELCYSMSDMDGCAEWKAMCTNTAASAWPFCDFASDDTSLPPMRMWFHADVAEIILFRQWIPRNSLAFAGSWFAVALMAFVAEFLRFLRQRAEQKWKFERLGKNDTKFAFGVDVPRALFHTAQLGWGYIVMLLVMTYNVGLFFAVLTGHLFGSLAFGRFMKAHPEPETVTEDCCSTNP